MKKAYKTPSIEVVRADVQTLLLNVSDDKADLGLTVLSKKNGFLEDDDDMDNE